MTAENPADTVIEQAARAITACIGPDRKWADCTPLLLARALQAAHLLADPADRDEPTGLDRFIEGITDPLYVQGYLQGYQNGYKHAEAEVAELKEAARKFSEDAGFGNGKTEPAAPLANMLDPIKQAFAAEKDHDECPVICELCGEPLATKCCDECHGSGCLPNSALAYLECGTCAGAGKVHEGCVEKSYTDLAAEVAELRAIITDAGLETYTPDGSERVAAHLTEQQRIITGLRAQVAAMQAELTSAKAEKRELKDVIDELRATIDRVRAIHEPIDAVMNPGPRERIVKVCTGCGTDDGNWQRWPCPTVRALDGAGEQQ